MRSVDSCIVHPAIYSLVIIVSDYNISINTQINTKGYSLRHFFAHYLRLLHRTQQVKDPKASTLGSNMSQIAISN